MRFDYGYTEESHLGKPYDIHLLKRLLPFLRPYRKLLLASVALVVALTLLELALPYFSKVVIDRYIVPTQEVTHGSGDSSDQAGDQRLIGVEARSPEAKAVVASHPELFRTRGNQVLIAYKDLKQLSRAELVRLRQPDLYSLLWVVVLFLAVVALNFGLTFAQRVIMEYAGHQVMHDLRFKLYDHIQHQGMTFFARQPVARLVTRTTNDVQNMHELFTTFIAMVFKDSFLLLGIAVLLVALDWRLALAGFVLLPMVVLASMRFATRARDVFRALRVKVAEINSRMAETIDGIKTIQSFGQERANQDHFKQLNQENYCLGMQQIHIFAIFMPVIEVLGFIAIALLILFGGYYVVAGAISLGALVAAISYMRMFFRPLRDLAENYNVLQNAMASAERIFGLFDTEQRLPQISTAAVSRNGLKLNCLEFEKVSFAYAPGEWVLRDVSFSVAHGRKIALVGPTGAGKTSILNLILRFYDPDAGQIRLNNRDVRNWDTGRLRSMMALVPQDSVLFSGTLRQNIFPADENRTDDDIQGIIDAANIRQLVERLPRGLDTDLVKSGASLSSGERQLVAIARALARNPQLILLDEATSYIDSQTEAAVHQALDNLLTGRTSVIVAHRLSTARTADQIIVLRQGRIKESGTHEDLLELGGLYWRLTHHLEDFHPGPQPP